MDALLIIDMQVGICTGVPCHDIDGVVSRINALSASMREQGSPIVYIQHDGLPDSPMAPLHAGWQLLPLLRRQPVDWLVRKTASDAFYHTALESSLRAAGVKRLVITGYATEFCVDSTLRSALSRDFDVIAVADGHTTRDRPWLDALGIIAHHQWVWSHLRSPGPRLTLSSTATLLQERIVAA